MESALEAGCWLKTVRSEESLCNYGRTGPTIEERRRILGKTKTSGKATGNHPGKYVIRDTVSMQSHHSVV